MCGKACRLAYRRLVVLLSGSIRCICSYRHLGLPPPLTVGHRDMTYVLKVTLNSITKKHHCHENRPGNPLPTGIITPRFMREYSFVDPRDHGKTTLVLIVERNYNKSWTVFYVITVNIFRMIIAPLIIQIIILLMKYHQPGVCFIEIFYDTEW